MYAGDSSVYEFTLADVVVASSRFVSAFISDINFFFSLFSRNMRATDAHSFTFEHGLVRSTVRNLNVRIIGLRGGAHSSETCSAMLGAASTQEQQSTRGRTACRLAYSTLAFCFAFASTPRSMPYRASVPPILTTLVDSFGSEGSNKWCIGDSGRCVHGEQSHA